MDQFLADAPLGYLLGLMVVPLGGAVLIIGFLFFSYSRRAKKSKMKHGIAIDESPEENDPPDAGTAASDNALNTSILSQTAPPAEPTPDLAAKSPARHQPVSAPVLNSSENKTPSASNDAPVTASSPAHKADQEALAMTKTHQLDDERIDLAARLGNQPETVTQNSEAGELLRLLQDPESGQLIVEVAGQRYKKLADVSDREVGQYILKLTAHLLAFNNGMIATEGGLKSVHNPKVGETPLPLTAPMPVSQLPDPLEHGPSPSTSNEKEPAETESPLVPKPSPEAEAAFQAALRATPPQPAPPAPERGGLFNRSKPSSDEPSLLPALNLAEEIDKIVQARLLASPLAQTTELVISADPNGGIRIKVNHDIYSSPDDIPDPEVKELIKASIKQWERS